MQRHITQAIGLGVLLCLYSTTGFAMSSETTGGSGSVNGVGPGCSSGTCWTDGQPTSGDKLLVWEGSTPDGNDLTIIAPVDPGSPINLTLPTSTGTLARSTGDTWTGTHSYADPNAILNFGANQGQLLIPLLSDPNDVDLAREFAAATFANHGRLLIYTGIASPMVVPAIPIADLTTSDNHIIKYDLANTKFTMEADAGGAGSGAFDDTADPIVQSTKGKKVEVGAGAGTLTAKLEVSPVNGTDDPNNPVLVIEGAASQVDSLIIAQTSADAQVFNVDVTGDVLATSIQDIDTDPNNSAWSIDAAGNVDLNSVTFTQDTTNPEIAYAATPAIVFDINSDGFADITFTQTSIDIVGNATGPQQLELKEATGTGTDAITFTAPSAITAAGFDCQLLDDSRMVPQSCVEAQVYSHCDVLYAPNTGVLGGDDVESVFRAPAALTITEVWCETDAGTVTMDVQIDDGTPADVVGTDLDCISTGDVASGLSAAMADGDRLDWLITSVSVAPVPTRVTVCIEYTFD
jgi:hypothetical protein